MGLNEQQKQDFLEQGFLVMKNLATTEEVAAMRDYVAKALNPMQAPLEYESDVGYPGAPSSRNEEGGLTPRRLLHAYSRDECFRSWARHPIISSVLRELLGAQPMMSQSHHNCIMTKSASYSSLTNWHQDVRYWSFDKPELISVWLALGKEVRENGCLLCIPKSHYLELDRGRLDQYLFLRTDLPENQDLIQQAVEIELEPGDVLFFHSRLFHAAGSNETNQMKCSVVFTYHSKDNHAIPGTKSANYPSIELEP